MTTGKMGILLLRVGGRTAQVRRKRKMRRKGR